MVKHFAYVIIDLWSSDRWICDFKHTQNSHIHKGFIFFDLLSMKFSKFKVVYVLEVRFGEVFLGVYKLQSI